MFFAKELLKNNDFMIKSATSLIKSELERILTNKLANKDDIDELSSIMVDSDSDTAGLFNYHYVLSQVQFKEDFRQLLKEARSSAKDTDIEELKAISGRLADDGFYKEAYEISEIIEKIKNGE